MNFLAPLFLLAAAAIAVPIAVHLVRRRPEKLIRVSSDLFLEPQPPTSQRSRKIDRWWLLLARCSVLLLIAFAFARPFIAQGNSAISSTAVLRMILLDRSASMNREGVAAAVATPLQTATEADEDATQWLATFQEQPLVTMDGIASLQPSESSATDSPPSDEELDVRQAASQAAAQTGWGRGDLDAAATLAVQQFREWRQLYPATTPIDASLTILSDLQQSNVSTAPLSALTAAGWPAQLRLEIPALPVAPSGNVAIELLDVSVQKLASEPNTDNWPVSAAVRLRLQADPNFAASSIDLRIVTAEGLATSDLTTEAHSVAIAAGQRRIERWRTQLPPAGALAITGDAVGFDDYQYFAVEPPQRPHWLVLSAPAPGEPIDEMAFYLEKIAGDNALLPTVQITAAANPPADAIATADVVFADADFLSRVDEATVEALAEIVAAGTRLIWVLDGEMTMTPAIAGRLQHIAPAQDDAWATFTAAVTEVDDYLLWANVDRSAIPFDLFGDQPVDLSKIRFWQSRLLENLPPNAQTLVAYDNGYPAWVRVSGERGQIDIVASSWRRSDSNLALSTKFVPLLLSLSPGRPLTIRPTWQINQPLPTELIGQLSRVEHLRAGGPAETYEVDPTWRVPAPGLYRWEADGQTFYAAANVDRRESDLRFLQPSELLPEPAATGEGLEREDPNRLATQRQPVQWERSQSWWRYLIVVALVFVAWESALASRGKVQQF